MCCRKLEGADDRFGAPLRLKTGIRFLEQAFHDFGIRVLPGRRTVLLFEKDKEDGRRSGPVLLCLNPAGNLIPAQEKYHLS